MDALGERGVDRCESCWGRLDETLHVCQRCGTVMCFVCAARPDPCACEEVLAGLAQGPAEQGLAKTVLYLGTYARAETTEVEAEKLAVTLSERLGCMVRVVVGNPRSRFRMTRTEPHIGFALIIGYPTSRGSSSVSKCSRAWCSPLLTSFATNLVLLWAEAKEDWWPP